MSKYNLDQSLLFFHSIREKLKYTAMWKKHKVRLWESPCAGTGRSYWFYRQNCEDPEVQSLVWVISHLYLGPELSSPAAFHTLVMCSHLVKPRLWPRHFREDLVLPLSHFQRSPGPWWDRSTPLSLARTSLWSSSASQWCPLCPPWNVSWLPEEAQDSQHLLGQQVQDVFSRSPPARKCKLCEADH